MASTGSGRNNPHSPPPINWQAVYEDLQALFQGYQAHLKKSTQNAKIRDGKLTLLKWLAGDLLEEGNPPHIIDYNAETITCLERAKNRYDEMTSTFKKHRGIALTRFFIQLLNAIGRILPQALRYYLPLTEGEKILANIETHINKLGHFKQPSASEMPPNTNAQVQEKAAIIGCGWHGSKEACNDEDHPPLHPDKKNYFTIDRYGEPDFQMDITQTLSDTLRNRFPLTILEHLDGNAYNDALLPPYGQPDTRGQQGFQNIWDMTAEEGFILIVGCPREKNFRQSIVMRELKYIELDANGQQECVLIHKNQHATIDDIQSALEELPTAFKKTINNAILWKNDGRHAARSHTLSFCNASYAKMEVTGGSVLRKQVKKSNDPQVKAKKEEIIERSNRYYMNSVQEAQSNASPSPDFVMFSGKKNK